jgi:hypothetical protein
MSDLLKTGAILDLLGEQVELLGNIVAVYNSGCKSEFILIRHPSGGLVYPGCPQVEVRTVAPDSDFQRLNRNGLLDLWRSPDGKLQGKPTARGVRFVQELRAKRAVSHPTPPAPAAPQAVGEVNAQVDIAHEVDSNVADPSVRVGPSRPNVSTTGAQAWSDLTITFLSDERVMIEFRGTRETRSYGEMGFDDQRGGRPRLAWIGLREMSDENGKPRQMDKKRAQEIRSLLKRHFSVDSDPLHYQQGLGYSARFKLRRSGSFDS